MTCRLRIKATCRDRFARLPPPLRFSGGDWEQLRLKNALAVIVCRLRNTLAVGDHAMLVLGVESAEVSPRDPLVWCRSQYRSLDGAAPR